MARPRKLTEKRQNRETKDVVLLAPGDNELAIPEPPVKLNVKALRQWAGFWRSPVASAVNLDSDGFSIERWITYVHEWYDCTKALSKPVKDENGKIVSSDSLLVLGSQGQLVLNPLAKHRQFLETALSALEKQLGLTPAARAQLGINLNTYKKSTNELLTDLQNLEPEILEG